MPQRTRSVSEGQRNGSPGTGAKVEEVALAHASGFLWHLRNFDAKQTSRHMNFSKKYIFLPKKHINLRVIFVNRREKYIFSLKKHVFLQGEYVFLSSPQLSRTRF